MLASLPGRLLDDLRIAAVFLTRLPVPWPRAASAADLARAMRLFPVVGFGLGLAAAAMQAVGLALGLPPLAAAALALAALALLTGGLHEDGLADTADGIGARADRARSLAIMRDSRIGAHGALALLLVLLLRAAALAAAEPAWLVLPAAEAAGRAAAPALMAALPPARADGLAATTGRVPAASALVAGGLALLALLVALPTGRALLAGVFAAAVVAGLGVIARRRLGGQTGDVAGAAILLAATAVLLVAAMR